MEVHNYNEIFHQMHPHLSTFFSTSWSPYHICQSSGVYYCQPYNILSFRGAICHRANYVTVVRRNKFITKVVLNLTLNLYKF